jgi:hypothetical protein
MLLLPNEPESDNIRALAQLNIERQTGFTGTAMTLEFPVAGTSQRDALLLFKNNTVLIPTTDYTVAGKAITLIAAALSTDIYVAWYLYRQP